MIKIESIDYFNNLYLIHNYLHIDERGSFIKIYNKNEFSNYNLNNNLNECFYSISKKDVIRGMHFQKDRFANEKIIHVIKGSIIDVVVNINTLSSSFGDYHSIKLTDKDQISLYVGKDYAHGFLSLEEDTIVMYLTTKEYDSKNDTGILWNSFEYDWNVKNPIISNRDKNFKKLKEIYDQTKN